jgi:methylthioribose-1-phosphate isomerase
MNNGESGTFQSIEWKDESLRIIDQTHLPSREVYTQLTSVGQVWEAIKKLKVRGAPAIGIAGAYGLYLGVKDLPDSGYTSFYSECKRISDYLNSSRPTAVNLSWALNRLLATVQSRKELPVSDLKSLILETAKIIHDEDRRMCKSIGEHGVELVPDNARVLTHCNTGGLATGQYGTAFSVIYHAYQAGKIEHVWVDETRPLLQGARLTTWELSKAGIPHSLNVDSAAAFLMQTGRVDMIITGADRITKNGDAANKIGTYALAVLAGEHGIPFYIAAPSSTIDMNLESGNDIEIELREEDEVTSFAGKQAAPDKTDAFNPAFDVTPNRLITAIITEKGILKPDYSKQFKTLFT